ncbi:MAG TPA: MmcQ/YjbR family DNA-binding protein [Acidobacteriaceae bacterium]|nr:MmcQ/YjbR family DNA-binding protein [Acidobacteriaceae bacterium]
MTPAEFRRLALSLPDTEEKVHMQHPDFRRGGKIFATLAYPDESFAMVKVFPDQQEAMVAASPKTFLPVKGGWGKQGCTNVLLKTADKEKVCEALSLAWERAAHAAGKAKRTAKSTPEPRRKTL